jgi:hypothetical protein
MAHVSPSSRKHRPVLRIDELDGFDPEPGSVLREFGHGHRIEAPRHDGLFDAPFQRLFSGARGKADSGSGGDGLQGGTAGDMRRWKVTRREPASAALQARKPAARER